MERAGAACFDWIYENAPQLFPHIVEEKNYLFQVVCGTGNNGGDGLVIARMLQKHGYSVEVFIVRLAERGSDDFEINLERLSKKKVKVTEVRETDDLPDFADDAVIVDAIFGTGLNRPAEGVGAAVIEKINASGARVVSIDMPSGLFCSGNVAADRAPVVQADWLLTFQVPKRAFFLDGSFEAVGDITTLDIGLHPDFLEEVETDHHLFTAEEARSLRRRRSTFSHKGDYGHTLLIAGAPGKRGAALLAASGAIRSGAGLVTVHTDAQGALPIHVAIPEAMVSTDRGDHGFTSLPTLESFDAIGVGPGLGTDDHTARAFKQLIQQAEVPLIIDADGLNLLAENPSWLSFLPPGTILTPHPGEFARLTGKKASHVENLDLQRNMSAEYGIHIVLKGAHTSTSGPDGRIIFNHTGNPGMATGGMGDVLTGIITALRAQGYDSTEACTLGAYIHGLAGDLALEHQSEESLTPTDLIQSLGKAFQTLQP